MSDTVEVAVGTTDSPTHGESEEQAAQQAATRRDMDAMVAQLDELTREVRALRAERTQASTTEPGP